MKTIYRLLLLSLLPLAFTACERDFDAPPLTEPTYQGNKANITIAELKEVFAAGMNAAVTIDDDYILRAWVAGNDESGNIYKQMILQDETGGIVVGVDQNSTYTTYRVGQEVFVQLNGMCMSAYGGELQLGYPDAYLYRTPWEEFQKHLPVNGWPDEKNIVPLIVNDFSKLNAIASEVAFTVVKLNNVSFVNGGKNTFAPADAYGSETITDAKGNTMVVRTSSYASFAANKLPKGRGSILGVLGRFNGAWQLTVRTADDVREFTTDGATDTPDDGNIGGGGNTGGDNPQPPVTGSVIFSENFGVQVDKQDDGFFPGVDKYTGWQNSNLTFSDPSMGSNTYSNASVRQTGGLPNPHIWFAANKLSQLKIEGFSTEGKTNLTLTYDIAANADGNQTAIKVICGEQEVAVPDKAVPGNNTFQTVTITGLPAGFSSITFSSEAEINKAGYRLDNVKLIGE